MSSAQNNKASPLQSRKGGTRTRRINTHVTSIEDTLQVLRNVERVIGKVQEKPNAELFFEDKAGDEKVKKNRKQLTIDKILTPASQIQVPKGRILPKKSTTRKATSKKGQPQYSIVKNESKSMDKFNIWGDEKNETTHKKKVKDEKATTTPFVRFPASKQKAIHKIHPGSSYNPSLGDHQDALVKAVQLEKKRLDAQKVSNLKLTKEQQQDIETSQPELNKNELAIPEPPPSENPIQSNKPKKRKTRAQRNKESLRNEKKRQMNDEKKAKVFLNQLDQIKRINKEIKTEEQVQKQKKVQKEAKKRQKEDSTTKRFGKGKFEEPMFPVQLTEDLSDSLRAIKVEGNPLTDRFKGLQKRNMIEVSRVSKKKSKNKQKYYEKHSSKNFV